MTEEVPAEAEADEGLVFHEGTRLTDLKIQQKFVNRTLPVLNHYITSKSN